MTPATAPDAQVTARGGNATLIPDDARGRRRTSGVRDLIRRRVFSLDATIVRMKKKEIMNVCISDGDIQDSDASAIILVDTE